MQLRAAVNGLKMRSAATDFQVLAPAQIQLVCAALCFKDKIQLFCSVNLNVNRPVGIICADGRVHLEAAWQLEKHLYVRVVVKVKGKAVFYWIRYEGKISVRFAKIRAFAYTIYNAQKIFFNFCSKSLAVFDFQVLWVLEGKIFASAFGVSIFALY